MYRLKTTANFNIGGGSGTVEEVIHDNTLIGKGTSESPLKVDQSKFAKPTDLNGKQDTLVSGTNIKTINNQSILGSGNINIEGGSGGTPTDVQINGSSITSDGTANIVTEGKYNPSTNKIATMSDISEVVDVKNDINALDNRLTAIDGHIDMELEMGNITIGNSGWGYYDSTSRVRLKQGTTIHLKPKDIIGLTDYTDAKFFLGWKLPNGTYGVKDRWNTADFVVSVEADYVVLLCNKTEKTLSSVNELSDLFFIKVNDSLVNNAIDKSKLEKLGTSIYYWEKMINGSHMATTDKFVANAARLCIPEVLHTENKMIVTADSGYRCAYHERNSSGGFVRDSGWQTLCVIPANSYFTMVFSKTDDSKIGINDRKHFSFSFADEGNQVVKETYNSKIIKPRGFIKSVNHRGYNDVAPENTLPAFILSKKCGFNYVETDISFTSDGIPVLLHDATINRTSNGTGAVSSYTYEQLLEFDFGSWKSSEYTGTKIPTLEEFLILCRNLGLHAYLEIKPIADNNVETYITNCVKLCIKCGMLRNVTWISFNKNYLAVVSTLDNKARVGLLSNGSYSEETIINNIVSLKNNYNEAFLDIESNLLTDTIISLCVDNNIPVEVWTVEFAGEVAALNPIVSGVTSNRVLSDEFMYNKAMSNYEFKF